MEMPQYVFETFELATQAERTISANMGYTLPERWSIPRVINNPENEYYNNAFIAEVEGDAEHHALWMTGVDGVISYNIVEYDQDWFLPEEI